MADSRIYGVSYGNGNDGVSQLYPDFYVRTDEPYRLARCALIDTMRTIAGRNFAARTMEIDGEAEFTISATLMYGPHDESEFGAAWLICEVFPVAESDVRDSKPMYDSLNKAITRATRRRIRAAC